jgi:hypothetical protein
MLARALLCVAFNAKAIVSISDAKGGRYESIVSRNAFGLHPPEKSHTEPSAPVVVRPKIRLVGITTLLGRRTAFLMVPAVRPGGISECLLLREGETQEEIEVREISDKVVKLINHGEKQTLGFDETSPAPSNPLPIDKVPFESGIPVPLPAPEKPSLTPEQQTLLIEAERMKAIQDGDPLAKILPQTEFTAEITGETP